MELTQDQILQLRQQYGFDKPTSTTPAPEASYAGKTAEDRFRELGWTTPEPVQPEHFKAGGFLGAIQDVAHGAGKAGLTGGSFAPGILDVGHFGQKIQGVVGKGLDALTGDKYDFSGDANEGVFAPQSEQGAAIRREAEPTNLAEKVGGGIEQVASLALPIGGAPAKTILGKAAQGAGIGAGLSGAQAVADDKSADEVAKDMAVGGAAGFALGGAGGAVSKLTTPKGVDQKVREFLTPIVNKNKTGEYAARIRAGKVTEGGLIKGREIAPDAHQIEVEDVVKAIPGIDKVKSNLDANNLIHDQIGAKAAQLEADLANREVQPVVTQQHWNDYIDGVEKAVEENPLLTGDAQSSAIRIMNKFSKLLPKDRDITASDILSARKELDIWMKSLRGSGVLDPAKESAASIGLRAVRQGANNLLAELSPDVAVKQSLREQSLLYDAVDTLSEKALKEAPRITERFFENHPLLGKAAKYLGAAAAITAIGGAAGYGGSRAEAGGSSN
jgi:hypothetical protein